LKRSSESRLLERAFKSIVRDMMKIPVAIVTGVAQLSVRAAAATRPLVAD
jgi:hypothetical protein